VIDGVAPTALCQNITVQLDGAGSATILPGDVDNGSTDACGIDTLSLDIDTFSCADVGTPVTVTLTVTDCAGNSATCQSTVTVQDNVAPTALCQNITVQLDAAGSATIVPGDVDNGSTDACGIDTLSLDIDTFGCADVGTPVTVTLTVTDVNANSSQCTATVTVQDNVAPTALCQDITVQLDAAGSATIVPGDVDNGSSDACGIDTLSLDIDTFSCADVGTPVTVTLTVTDVNANSSQCTATVTVQDNVAPTALCQDITVQLDAAGSATIVPGDVDFGSTDACGIGSPAASTR
jgi:predicted thioesterase